METLTDRLRKSQKDLVEHGALLLGQTREASKGFAAYVQGEARDWTAYLRERAAEIQLDDVKNGAADLLGKVTGRTSPHETVEEKVEEQTGESVEA